ncbi:hypothetical protein ACFVT2_25170 [Streptomyces sp. NPDC058000]|uniref:hypothetical protein n=1 Tax=Streptomyces sp. NPDC058000 TaxID=3346299 RepID=UPI0036EA54F1
MTTTRIRYALGLLGATGMAVGVLLVTGTGWAGHVVLWLAGAVALHDGVLAPLVLGVGLPLAGRAGRRGPGPVRGAVRGALIAAGALTAVALPALLRPGAPANSSVLPLDYPRGWLVSVLAVAAGTGALVGVRLLVRRRTVQRRRS